MGLSTSEKAEFSTYQLKDLSQTWYAQWRDNTLFRGRPVTWEDLKKAFHDRFYPKEKHNVKAVEFIKIHQGSMSVLEYSLKFTQLPKYAPYLVSDPRDELNHFVTGVLDDFHRSVIRLCYMTI